MDKKQPDAKVLLKGAVLHNYLKLEVSLAELKREALTRRSDKLMEWLHRPEYALYTGPERTEKLGKL